MSRWLEAAQRASALPAPHSDKTDITDKTGVVSVPSVLSEGPLAENSDPAGAPAADLDAFEEQAAIAEHDGGLTRQAAEQWAAEAQRFDSSADLLAAAKDGWRLRLEGLRGRVRSLEGQRAVEAALCFVAEDWAMNAAALGWPELELFGADPRAPWARLDRLGAAYSPFTPFAVTRDAILYGKPGEAPLRRWRGSQADGAVLAWEAET